jgi:hypothetical protein
MSYTHKHTYAHVFVVLGFELRVGTVLPEPLTSPNSNIGLN